MSPVYMTNKAEIFYIDAHFLDAFPDVTESTLVHEFQHMIHFNEQFVKQGNRSSTWYNEMLSMLAEDLITPMIGIDSSGYPERTRMPLFLSAYNRTGITSWLDGADVYFSYANAFAFGAYLVRNYGGAELLSRMAKNNAVNEAAIEAAIRARGFELDFKDLLRNYAETFVRSQISTYEDSVSFNRSVTSEIGGSTYTFNAIDIWDMVRKSGYGVSALQQSYGAKGPRVFAPQERDTTILGRSFLVQSCEDWQKVEGELSITLTKPVNTGVINMFIVVR
jgi:hypothetical protein